MMLSNILQALFGTINDEYLGQMIGVDALAAVSVFFPVMFFSVAFVMRLSSGATVLVGQAWGGGDPGKVRAVASATPSRRRNGDDVVGGVGLARPLNGFGSSATAAYGAVKQVLSYVQFPALSIAISVSIFGAQAIGRGNSDRLGSIVRAGLLMNLVLTGGLVALAYLFSRTIVSLFIIDAAVLDLAQGLLHIVLWSSVRFGMATVFSGMMRASGTVLMPLLISIFAIAAVEVPAAVMLSRAIGIEGVWAAYPITFIAMFVLQMSYYMLVWRKRAIRRLI